MSVEDLPWVEVSSRSEWRDWLTAHHTQRTGIWLVTFKKHCGDRYLEWGDIVKECLCFGWIDSRSKRVDEDRTRVLVTPRKPGSMWSAVNKAHIRELEAAGLIEPAGRAFIEAAKEDGSWTYLDEIDALVVPPDLAEALETAGAKVAWEQLAPSKRKVHLLAIKQAKRASTRTVRIERAVQGLV